MYLVAGGPGLAAFAVFAWWVIPLAVVMGAVAERSRTSVIVATVLYAVIAVWIAARASHPEREPVVGIVPAL
jgi:hypothetical protein